MGKTDFSAVQKELSDLFGDRIRFDEWETRLYSRDMGVLPDTLKKTIDCMPFAVVQPVSQDELLNLLRIASSYELPLVPRGAGTSGYGGIIPTRGGIVVDFVRMKNILEIDPDTKTVTVEPAVVWADLDAELEKQGLATCLYPSSAISSTIAGLVAQGGTGIGGFEYGKIGNIIDSLELITPEGQLKKLEGDDLRLVIGLNGITGFIVKITLKVRSKEDHKLVLAAFPSAAALAQAFNKISEESIPLWSVNFANPKHVALRQAAADQHLLPEDKYLGMFVYPSTREQSVQPKLDHIIAVCGGESLNDEQAQHEWEERFYPMRMKKFGPSLVPSEVILPVSGFTETFAALEKRYKDIALEGFCVGPDHVVLLTFLLADERDLAFPMVYASTLVVLEEAKRFGGETYALGIYLADEAEGFLGKEMLNKIKALKDIEDPKRLFNPGKALPPDVEPKSPVKALNAAMKAAKVGKSVLSGIGRLLSRSKEKAEDGDLLEQLKHDAFVCTQCGYCRATCTMFRELPWESSCPRGKWNLLLDYAKGNTKIDIDNCMPLFVCTTCRRCDQVCQVDLPSGYNWFYIRSLLFDKFGLEHTGFGFLRKNIQEHGNFWGQPRENAHKWVPEGITYQSSGPLAYWPGCWASFVSTDQAANLVRILNAAGEEFVYLGEKSICCGGQLNLITDRDKLLATIKKNIEILHEAGVKTLIVTCPGCLGAFKDEYPEYAEELGLTWDIEVKHAAVYIDDLIKTGKIKLTKLLDYNITYQDPCHLGRWQDVYDEPRRVIQSVPGVRLIEMEHNREDALCCGATGSLTSLEAAAKAGARRMQEVKETGADTLVTTCAGCGSNIYGMAKAADMKLRVKDLTDLVCEAMGMEVDDFSETMEQGGPQWDLLEEMKVVKVK